MKKQFITGVVLILLANIIHGQSDTVSLKDILSRVAKGNRHMQIKTLETIRAQMAIREAKSYRLPSVNASGAYNIYAERPVIYLRNEAADPKLNEVRFGGRMTFDASVTATYPLIQPAIRQEVRLLEVAGKITEVEKEELEQQLALNASQLYYALLLNKKQAVVLWQSLQRNEKALKDSRSLFLQGKNLKTDTLSNYISLQNLKASLMALESQEKLMRTQLNQLMGSEEAGGLVPADSLGVEEGLIQSLEEALQKAGMNRRDLQSQNLLIEKEKLQLQAVAARYKPQLLAIAQYQVQSQADHFRLGDYQLPRTSFAGVRLSIPLYSGQRSQHQKSQVELSIREKELALKEMVSSVTTELTSIYAQLQNALNQWRIQQQNVAAAEINYQMMNDRYRMGMGTRLELTDAELALTRARLNEAQHAYDIAMLQLQLQKATGSIKL